MTAAEVPLSMAATGKPLRVVRIDAGRGLTRRLADLGLTPGVELERVDASEAWSATAMLHGRGVAGFLRGWRHRRPGGPATGDRGRRGFGFFGGWPRRGPRGHEPEGMSERASGRGGHRQRRARSDEPADAERPGSGSWSFRGRHKRRLGGPLPEDPRERRSGLSGRGRHDRSGGAVVVEFRGSKYVLGYGVSEKIVVSEDRGEAGPRREEQRSPSQAS